MSKRNLIVWAAVATVMAVLLLSVAADQRASYLWVGGSAVVIVAASTWLMYQSWCGAYVERHPRRIQIIGWAVVAAALAIGIVYPALVLGNLLPLASTEAVIEAAVVLGILGAMIASSPRMVAQMKRAREKGVIAKTIRPKARIFSPFTEGWRATLTILRSPLAFLQIAGTWAAALTAGYFILITTADGRKVDPSIVSAIVALALGCFLAVPTTSVAWSRWVGLGQKPRHLIALPNWAVVLTMWRLWVFNLVVGAIDGPASAKIADVAQSLGIGPPEIVGAAAALLFYVLAVVLAAPFAVRLAAIALGDKDFRITDLVLLRRAVPTLGAGLMLAMALPLALFVVFSLLCASLPASRETLSHPGPVTLTWLSVGLALLFATFASGGAYLTRAYQAARATD